MKKLVTLLLLLVSVIGATSAQEFTTKYGKVTKDELAMKSYSKDTTASAVILYKTLDVCYFYNDAIGNFEIEYYYEAKIKVLKPDGVNKANISIPFYDTGKSGSSRERVSKIEAFAYNMENGKIQKTKMEKNYIFEEQSSPVYKRVKFTIPVVKEGTVIEYKYKLSSPFWANLNDMEIQEDIPVVYAKYQVRIPEYFFFNIDTRGYERLKTEDIRTNETFMVQTSNGTRQPVTSNSRQLTFIANELSALKDEPNVWCSNDFCTKVTFELRGIQFPFSAYEPYTNTWEKIEELLKKEDGFGDMLKLKNPYKDEMGALNLSNLSQQEKIRAIFQLLRKKMSWNGNYAFFGNETKKAIKNGTGNNADMNFVLISMLKDAGLNAFPVMMSTRDRGRLPYTYPSINKLNTFIVGINDTDSTAVFLDGSVKYGDINVIPSTLMVDRARTYNTNSPGSWVDLTSIGRHSINSFIKGRITADGKLEGERSSAYSGLNAASFRSEFKASKDSATYIQEMETENGISVKGFVCEELETLSPNVKEKVSFNKEISSNDEHIYLNPMIFPHLTKNPFTSETRKLPIEFSYPNTFKLACILDIPEGYQVEELPKSAKLNLEKQGCDCSYNIQVINNQIHLRYVFTLQRIMYSTDEYPSLRNFWGTVMNKNNEQIVLKKITSQNTQPAQQTSQQ
ncbi:DUF3857 domain-containing protein [Bacteroides sedimenti]|uniref:DUF3857 domain-containing protein n=1 Tax=Bacteroides sedimenti TaxID=2136147 RepID=A0ABN6ZBR2_9BACE